MVFKQHQLYIVELLPTGEHFVSLKRFGIGSGRFSPQFPVN